jgi:hypothetical protein
MGFLRNGFHQSPVRVTIMSTARLQLKLTLVDAEPLIWRRLLVTNQISLKRLHESIQAVTGWDDPHQHDFIVDEKCYGQPALGEVVPVENEALFRLHSLPLLKGTSFTYVYDFGDHWEIEVKVEQVLPPDPGGPFAFLIEGARAFRPEDSGGVVEYENLFAALSDPTNPEHDECRQWLGEDFEPERLDLSATNERLQMLA